MQTAHAAPHQITGQPCRAPALRGFRTQSARGGAPKASRNGNFRHGARSKETNRSLEAHSIATGTTVSGFGLKQTSHICRNVC
jgi:hypothetical protein